MNHLLKKINFAGGGKSKPKAKPPILKPPIIGDHNITTSHSYAEILDLISDGPILGLVDKNGRVRTGVDMLKGVYLNDVAVVETEASKGEL